MRSNNGSNFEFRWIYSGESQPTVCVSCGMFTDNLVSVKHGTTVVKEKSQVAGCGAALGHLFLHFLLGPIGWILAAILSGQKEEKSETKIVKQNVKVRLSQCLLCHGTQSPQAVDVQLQPKALLFQVHPRYSKALDEENQKKQD